MCYYILFYKFLNLLFIYLSIDEVGAVVIDVGHFSIKVGYAGEDSPRSEIPSVVVVHDVPTTELDRYEKSASTHIRNYYVETPKIMVPRTGQEVKSFLKDGVGLYYYCYKIK